ncbi:hypothetical protein H7J07_05765 [Mycobacterium koreense]|uniref:hypothetical protein n=1 Tax=Mycolicibacillus koreensis TaxID=1069220 RepID=UPI001054909F|nr:hypothetical protein [Mycolicibacillus koreensis]MCV7247732.1 hypothetical protein [Mycolicibacillus koreensis]
MTADGAAVLGGIFTVWLVICVAVGQFCNWMDRVSKTHERRLADLRWERRMAHHQNPIAVSENPGGEAT